MRYGKEDATQEEMERAAEIAQASEFISRKPDGFNEHLSEGGSNFQVDKTTIGNSQSHHTPSEIYILMTAFLH